MKTITKLWLFIVVLAILAPLGLIVPALLRSGGAWGEWDDARIRELVGYVPRGLERLSSLWRAPLPDYAFKGCEGKPLYHCSIAYVVSAIIGLALTAGILFLIGRVLSKKDR